MYANDIILFAYGEGRLDFLPLLCCLDWDFIPCSRDFFTLEVQGVTLEVQGGDPRALSRGSHSNPGSVTTGDSLLPLTTSVSSLVHIWTLLFVFLC